jgi:hypothetical protein
MPLMLTRNFMAPVEAGLNDSRDRRTENDQLKVAIKSPTLFSFRHIEQRKPLFAGRISQTIVKRQHFQ